MKEIGKTLDELVEQIADERPYVNKKPYSHNIISLLLQEIAEKFGDEEAEKTIKKLRLDRLGW